MGGSEELISLKERASIINPHCIFKFSLELKWDIFGPKSNAIFFFYNIHTLKLITIRSLYANNKLNDISNTRPYGKELLWRGFLINRV